MANGGAEKRWLGALIELGAVNQSQAVSTQQIREFQGAPSINTEGLQRLTYSGKVRRGRSGRISLWHVTPRGLACMDHDQTLKN